MTLSSFILTLWVLLVATSTQLGWYAIDIRFIGAVGVVYVLVFIIEAIRGSLIPARRA